MNQTRIWKRKLGIPQMRRHLGKNQSELKVKGCENPQMRRD